MITIRRLSFEPKEFNKKELKSIEFDRGLNFIVGEKSENIENKKEREKMNGVGKSLLIEAINYCFLKRADESRITKIPDISLNPKIYICLDIEVESKNRIRKVTIKRNRVENDPIIIVVDDDEKTFDKLEEAKKYLSYLLLDDTNPDKPSFRSLLSILIREEDSLYSDILKPHRSSSVSSFEDLLKPHFYLFQINLDIIEKIKKVSQDLKNVSKTTADLRQDFRNAGIEVKEVASHINELKDSIEKLNLAIEELHPSEGMVQLKDRLNDLQIQLEKLVTTKASKEYLVKKIKSLPQLEKINTKQVQIIYNHFKTGLGDMVQKSFDQVVEFKKQVDDFQNTLMGEKLKELNVEITAVDEQISRIDNEIAKIYSKTEAKEVINGIKEAVKLEREKNMELEKLSQTYEILQAKISQQKSLKKKKEGLIEELEQTIFKIQSTVSAFEDDLKKMHDYIAGNKHCQFQINVNESSASFVEFDYRIKLDGSSGINRIKTFIYDTLLMVNKITSERHPKFLIHDNIFASTGRDDMVRSLNYLFNLSKKHQFQYILTINKDEFESIQKDFEFDIEKVKKAEFTRAKPFLGFEYSEL
ncbi:MAG: DUF2326 domain-containing protein [Candidatus Paceibacterota bacterium]